MEVVLLGRQEFRSIFFLCFKNNFLKISYWFLFFYKIFFFGTKGLTMEFVLLGWSRIRVFFRVLKVF